MATLAGLACGGAAAQLTSVEGIVVTARGEPVAGASVFSGRDGGNATTSDAAGRFRLDASTGVLHTEKEGFEPVTIILAPPATGLHIVLEAAVSGSSLVAEACGSLEPAMEALRLGRDLEVLVPRQGWSVSQLGTVENTEYILKQRHGRAEMTVWSGAHALEPMPDDSFFLESSTFSQRAMVAGGSDGVDSSGTYADGTRWRRMAIGGSGATYDRASAGEAQAFDAVIGTLCRVAGTAK